MTKDQAECMVANFNDGGAVYELAEYLWDWQESCDCTQF